jgi:hypothetical protein
VAFLAGYGKRKEIRYGTEFPDANLDDFPKLFKITADSDIAAELASGGGIAVTLTDETTAVPFGLYPSSDPASGDLILRAKFDVLTAASTGDVLGYLYYDAGATTTEDTAGVVSNGYAVFCPMEGDPAGSAPQFLDWVGAASLTAANLDGTDTVAGRVGAAVRFDDSADSSAAASGVSELPTEFGDVWTNSFLHRTRSLVSLSQYWGFGSALSDGSTGTKRNVLCFGGNYYFWGENADWGTGIAFDADSDWHAVDVTSDGSSLRLYVDGMLAAGPQPIPYAAASGTTVTAGGHHPAGASPDADIDECSVATVARSADWLAYAHLDDFANEDTFTLGPQETVGSGVNRRRRVLLCGG